MYKAETVARVCGGKLIGSGDTTAPRVVTDSRKIKKNDMFIAISGENFDGNTFAASAAEKGAAFMVLSREDALPEGSTGIIVADTRDALLRIASYHRDECNVKVVGVTGSVGKTTTKDMIACALSARFKTHKTQGNFNNDIGMPLTLLDIEDDDRAAVIEMGMSSRGEISRLTRAAKPDVAVITNIGMSHIEHLKTRENILAAKLEILEGLKEGGTVILNADDEYLSRVSGLPFKTMYFGIDHECDVHGRVISDNTVEVLGQRIKLAVAGRHNLLNACCAMAAAASLGIDAQTAAKGIMEFKTDDIRQNAVKSPRGFTVIRDYYNASPQSVSVALRMLGKKDGRKIAVLGDMLELGDFSEQCHKDAGREAALFGIDILFTYGNEMKAAHQEALKHNLEAVHFENKNDLSEYLLKVLREGDTVLIKGSHGMKMEDIYEKIMG